MSLTAGTKLGPYEIVSLLGAGGMGEVYKARDPRLGRDIAIKVIASLSADDPDRRRRFEREAHAIAALNHPNILAIYDVGEMADGPLRAPYLVTELLEGETLRARLQGRALPPRKVIEVALQMAAALAAAHARGIIHRDLKPENVFVTRDGHVKILDFGLAKTSSFDSHALPSAGHEAMTATIPGFVLGTVGYMSPEQVRGGPADPRSDLFSLGVILYEMVTGVRAFHRDSSADTLSAILKEDPAEFSVTNTAAPPAFERLIRRCLEKDPDGRFQTARDLRFALEAISTDTDSSPGRATSGASAAPRVAEPTAASIAVLPFADMSAQHDQAYFCEGMAEEIINALARVEGLRVAPRSSTFQAKTSESDLRTLADILRVGTILEGSVRTAGQRLRVTAQLVDVAAGRAIWAEKFDGDAGDVFAIQDAITEKIVAALTSKLVHAPVAPSIKRHTENLEAYHAYLRGRHHRFSTFRFPDAVTAFERAVALEPDYAPAWAGLGSTIPTLAIYGGLAPAAARGRSGRAAQRALQIDSQLPDAYVADGNCRLADRDWDGARRALEQALVLDRASFDAHPFLALLWALLHRGDDARREVSIAHTIEPLSVFAFGIEALCELHLGAFEAAHAAAARAVELQPDFRLGPFIGSTALVRLGRFDEAVALAELGAQTGAQATYKRCHLAWVYGMTGRRDRAEAILVTLDDEARREYLSPYWRSLVLVGLGRHDEAMRGLDEAVDENSQSLIYLGSAWWTELRTKPAFQDMLRRLGLATARN